jgi:predicted N-formylglutamate amidohydrolase
MSSRTRLNPSTARLLEHNDPPPYCVVNPGGQANVVLVCDHGGNAVPGVLDNLGLPPDQLGRHIAWDIGAAAVTRALAARLDALALLAAYSRLTIDLNRPVEDLTSIREISDGVVIPGNRGLSQAEIDARIAEIFDPYHDAVAAAVAARPRPAIISLHSFTPAMKGATRPWHIGVLYNADARIATPLMAALSGDPELCIGDNKPYSGFDLFGQTIETHALPAGLLNVLLEFRQDLIDTDDGAEHWATIIAEALAPVLCGLKPQD